MLRAPIERVAIVIVLLGFGLGLAVSAAAAEKLTRLDRQWLEKDVSGVITQREAKLFQDVKAGDRELFKEIFWKRRDPDLTTEENEFLDEFNSRVRIADQYFKARGNKGSQTDMGLIFTLLGQPSQRAHGRSVSEARDTIQEGGGIQDSLEGSATEMLPPGQAEGGPQSQDASQSSFNTGPTGRFATWIYSPRLTGGTEPLELRFRAQPGFGYRLLTSGAVKESLDGIRESFVFWPNIKYELDEDGDLQPIRTSFVSTASHLLDELLETKETKEDLTFRVSPSFFRSVEGAVYMPVLFEVDEKGVSRDGGEAKLTFFGAVTNPEGQQFYRFEETGTFLGALGSTLSYEMPMQLPPGEYTVYLGVVDEHRSDDSAQSDEAPAPTYGSRVTALNVPAFPTPSTDSVAKDAEPSFSSVVVYHKAESSEEEGGVPGQAFQFGRLKLAPQGSVAFTKNDTLGLFYYIYGLDETTSGLTAQYVFFADGEEKAQTKPDAIPSRGDQAAGNVEVPLASFAAGKYRVLIRIKNPETEAIYEKWANFTLEG